MSGGPTRARVTLKRRRLWSLRATLSATRWLVYAAAAAGLAATIRNSLAPAASATIAEAAPAGPGYDAAAEWFALRFARAYLAWSGDPSARDRSLAPFLAAAGNPDAGLVAAPRTREAVAWTAIADAAVRAGGVRDYTVAVATASGSVRYLALAVGRVGGGEALLRYPALVGPPAPVATGSLDGASLRTLDDPALAAVLERALRNYVGGSAANLAADLAAGARVEPVAPGLALRTVERLAVEGPRTVLATVLATDAAGTAYTLGYEVAVTQLAGRWEITQIAS